MKQTQALCLCALVASLAVTAASMIRPGYMGNIGGQPRVVNNGLTKGFAPMRHPMRRPMMPHELQQISEKLKKMAFSLCYRYLDGNADACYGCFMRANKQMQCNGTANIAPLQQCTAEYLESTPFAQCAENLSTNATDMGLCDFEQCLRKTDTSELVRECLQEVGTKELTTDSFMDMTTCVLAKARCRLDQAQYGGMDPLQTLLVTDSKELRMVEVPGGFYMGDVCVQDPSQGFNPQRFPKPARWSTANCDPTC